jgi:putative flippase GtrA
MIGRVRSALRGHGQGAALFGLVGFLNVATDFAIYSVCVWLGVHPALANVISFVCANVQSYRVNAAVTFRRNGRPAAVSFGGYLRFAAAHLLGLAISTAFILLFTDAVGPIAAKALSVVFSAASNYALSARFVFREDGAPKSGAKD